jgi:DNA-binding IclR family transcriptional regulator
VTEIEPKAPPKHPIGSVDNAIRLLLLLREQSTIRVSEASERLGVVPSTAHRLLAMFEYYGVVEKDPRTKQYSPGPALLALGLSVVRHDVRAQLHPVMRSLVDGVRETCSLIVLEGTNSLFLDAIECDRPVRTTSRVGLIRPAHCTSGGKALLAELSDQEVVRRYPDEELGGVTPYSITSRSELLEELARVREQGYAISNRENEPDIAAIASVIRTREGVSVGALSISCPLSRYSDELVPEMALLLQRAAARAQDSIF